MHVVAQIVNVYSNRHLVQSVSHTVLIVVMFGWQSVLGEYVQAQMMFHAKALELLTVAFQQVQSIDEEGDLQVKFVHLTTMYSFGY